MLILHMVFYENVVLFAYNFIYVFRVLFGMQSGLPVVVVGHGTADTWAIEWLLLSRFPEALPAGFCGKSG